MKCFLKVLYMRKLYIFYFIWVYKPNADYSKWSIYDHCKGYI